MNLKHFLYLTAILIIPQRAIAQGTAFTYQGRLNDGAAAATGKYDLRFKLYADAVGNTQVGGSFVTNAIPVTNGLFITMIDFGAGIFKGSNYWLEVDVKTNGAASYTVLTPLQLVTPTPYAIFANTASNVSGTVSAAQLSGAIANGNLPGSPTFSGTVTATAFSGNGASLSSLTAGQLATGTVPDARLAPNVARTNQVWLLSGNAGIADDSQFLGTTDQKQLELRANGTTALRINSINTTAVPNLIGGFGGNTVDPGQQGTVIAGGGSPTLTNRVGGGNYSAIGGGVGNSIFATGSVIAGGYGNYVGSNSIQSAIGGGNGNFIGLNSTYGTIGGGSLNQIQTNVTYGTIGGGLENKIKTDSRYATLGGGFENTIEKDIYNPTIGGGRGNIIHTLADDTTIGGGYGNVIQTSANNATIGGGTQNSIQADADYATIPGGYRNSAAAYAFAAGTQAKANHTGAFVWADSQFADFASTAANQFLIRASGGVGIGTTTPGKLLQVGDALVESEGMMRFASRSNTASRIWDIGVPKADENALGFSFVIDDTSLGTNPEFVIRWNTGNVGIGTSNPQSALHVNGTITTTNLSFGATTSQKLNLYNTDYGIGVQNSTHYSRTGVGGGFAWFRSGVHTNTQNDPGAGGTLLMRLDTSGNLIVPGNVTANGVLLTSDRDTKENFTSLNSQVVLSKVAALPITEWNYKNDASGVHHIGPMAQDFYAAFQLNGADDKHISVVDAGGVALAAIQGLNEKVEVGGQRSEVRIKKLEAENAELKQRLEKLEQFMNQKNGGDR
ncbi:MAG: tail fiber domain-containing protein [Akkermansiaceae bacterium]|nr:tail fiber domain-containing protein [Verrucomicrobiales bacterium]